MVTDICIFSPTESLPPCVGLRRIPWNFRGTVRIPLVVSGSKPIRFWIRPPPTSWVLLNLVSKPPTQDQDARTVSLGNRPTFGLLGSGKTKPHWRNSDLVPRIRLCAVWGRSGIGPLRNYAGSLIVSSKPDVYISVRHPSTIKFRPRFPLRTRNTWCG